MRYLILQLPGRRQLLRRHQAAISHARGLTARMASRFSLSGNFSANPTELFLFVSSFGACHCEPFLFVAANDENDRSDRGFGQIDRGIYIGVAGGGGWKSLGDDV